MIDHLHGDLPAGGRGKGAAHRAVERLPVSLVHLGAQRTFELVVGFIGAGEVGVTYEEALFVVVGVDEPAGDAVGAVAADFAGAGVEHVLSLIHISEPTRPY